MKVDLDVVRVSALLHDIGKLDCWANRKPWSEHTHYTYKFVKACLGEDLAVYAMRHHTRASYSEGYRPKTLVENIVCLADNLASGADRREAPESGSYIPTPPIELTHVLNANFVRSSVDSARLAYLSQTLLRKLGNLEAAFAEDSTATYRRIFDILEGSELRFVPADTRKPINDVSLWNHLKLTAAFATCIFLEGYRGSNLSSYSFALLSGDADRISSFVNESLRLPDLNARSMLINEATKAAGEAVSRLLGPECLLYAAGGSFLAISPPEMAEKVLDEAKNAFEDNTGGRVTLTVSHVVADGEKFKTAYGEVWREAQRAMRLKKGQRINIPKVKASEDRDVCDVCGKVDAAKTDEQKVLPIDATPRPERLCDFCWELREKGKGVELDKLKDEANMVACIKADGDSIGGVFAGETFRDGKSKTPSRISTLSELINDICRFKLKKIVESSSEEKNVIYTGGDDLLAFVPGQVALKVASEVLKSFEENMAEQVSMSAGVAIFNYKQPVYTALEASDFLISEVKAVKKGCIGYAVLSSTGLTQKEIKKCMKIRTITEIQKILEIINFLSESELSSSIIWKIATLAYRDKVKAEAILENYMGNFKVGLITGNKLLDFIKSDLFQEAFMLYRVFRPRKIGQEVLN
ncbi:type III-B CRISPR-associated protein Cas10/Cmr2 [Candidatus Bathyarchaeota archaeon]|nr:type III-B CRISPR-associated protein Cas10/Cmr2 [Candidatus Bathyarchaeota archaeon]